jgi:hypothetical protein
MCARGRVSTPLLSGQQTRKKRSRAGTRGFGEHHNCCTRACTVLQAVRVAARSRCAPHLIFRFLLRPAIQQKRHHGLAPVTGG